MKKLLIALSIGILLTACGNPGVIAYTRGLMVEREAEKQVALVGFVDSAAQSKYFQAIEQYNSALHFDPKNTNALYRRGRCRARLSQYDAALSDFSEVVKLLPADPNAWRDRASTYKEMQMFAEAIKDYNTVETLSDADASLYLNRSFCKQYTGDRKGALDDAKKAVELKPDALAYCALATSERQMGNLKAMDEAFNKAIKLNPHRVSTYQSRGLSNFLCKRYAPAFTDFRKALAASEWRGSDTGYAVIFGTFSARFQKKDAEAKALLDEAMNQLQIQREVDKGAHNAEVAGDWPYPAIQYLHGDITDEKLIRAAQGDDGKETEARCYLGIVCWQKGDEKRAAQYFEWAAKNGRSDYVETELAHNFLTSKAH